MAFDEVQVALPKSEPRASCPEMIRRRIVGTADQGTAPNGSPIGETRTRITSSCMGLTCGLSRAPRRHDRTEPARRLQAVLDRARLSEMRLTKDKTYCLVGKRRLSV